MSFGLDKIDEILNEFTQENMNETFQKVIETDAFKLCSTGVCGKIVNFFLNKDNGNEIMYFFLKFLFSNNGDDPSLSNQLNFFFLWFRSSDETALDYQIKCLEEFSAQLKTLVTQNRNPSNCQLAIAQLLDRCSTHILPDLSCEIGDQMNSSDFLKKSPDLVRSKRAAEYRGRLHIISTRIFPAFAAFAMSKKCVPLEFDRDYSVYQIGSVIQKVATAPDEISSRDYHAIATHLGKVKCVEYVNRVPRLPSRVLTSISNLQDLDVLQDCEVCLQISIMCLICDSDNQLFPPLVHKFADMCKVDGNTIINIIKAAKNSYLKKDSLTTTEDITNLFNEPEPEKERPFKPLLEPFEINENNNKNNDNNNDKNGNEDDLTLNQKSFEDEIAAFAGDDRTKWFEGDGLTSWRAARMCVANCMDRLDPNSFSLLPEK